MSRSGRALFVTLLAACGNGSHSSPPDAAPPDAAPLAVDLTAHSSSLALSTDGKTLYAANADADSISVIDTASRSVTATIALGPTPTVVAGAYTPAIMPRTLALSLDGATLYATGERSGMLYAIDLASQVQTSVAVCSEPIGVLAGQAAVFVACSQDHVVAKVVGMQLAGTVAVAGEPWGLGWAPDGSLLATLFLGPGAAQIDVATFAAATAIAIPDVAPRADARYAHGQVRGIYDVALRPGTHELWFAHELLGTDTAQPTLDFERTAFPAISVVQNGALVTTLSTDAQDVAGIDGAFGDVVSGPHALAFTHDGAYALVVDTNSEDILVVGANRVESSLVRPLPGHMPEGIAIAPDDSAAYIDERNTGDIAVLSINSGVVTVDGPPIARLAADPMPAELRLGQHLFYSANSDEYPLTSNHWIACATCHMEGRSDAVTWLFDQGPRDTPTNAGGMLGTGFLFRTADRQQVQDYWHTVNLEQGGSFDPVAQKTLLDALAAYVNGAIPAPIPPATDATKVARGAQLFATAGCATCHSGPKYTDSGSGNPTLDLGGVVLLHDVGTCNSGTFPDVAHTDIDGDARAACMFDTPSLVGIASSAPYFHDGRAATLMDVLEQTRGKMGDISSLSADDEAALVEYLRSL